MAPWNKTTAPVLRRVRTVTQQILEPAIGQPKKHEIACANKVWAHLGVEMARYKEKDNWNFVEKALRPQVREKLEAIFDKAAFFVDGSVADPARDKFRKADLLAWGDQLRAEDAANAAAAAANAATPADAAVSTTAFNPPPPGPGTPAGEPTASEGVDGDLLVSELDYDFELFKIKDLEAEKPLSPAAAAANAPAGAAVANRVGVAADSNPDTAFEPAAAMACDRREESTDGRGAGPTPGATAPPSISSTGKTSLVRKVRKGFARATGRSGLFSGKESSRRLT